MEVVSPISKIVALGVCIVGHLALAVWLLNFSYGHAWPRRVLRILRCAHVLWAVFTTPALAVGLWATGFPEARWWLESPGLFAAYVGCCMAIGMILVPAVTVVRCYRKPPAWQLSNHTRVVDVQAQLGYRPVGRGRKQWLALLPGNQQFQVEVLDKQLALPGLPAEWKGLTILHLSDFHFAGVLTKDYYSCIFQELRGLKPDLVALTGDFIDDEQCYEWIPELFAGLRGRYGSFALLGNHDAWFDVERIRCLLSQVGFEFLGPHGRLLPICGRQLWISATEWPWLGTLPTLPVREFRGADFRLLLAHTPDVAYWASRHGFDLMLCGHNHGGQVKLPVVGPVYMPSRYGRKFDSGLFAVGSMALYVNKGLGGEHPLRFGARPEMAILRLHPR